jgi:hypothetical protein
MPHYAAVDLIHQMEFPLLRQLVFLHISDGLLASVFQALHWRIRHSMFLTPLFICPHEIFKYEMPLFRHNKNSKESLYFIDYGGTRL